MGFYDGVQIHCVEDGTTFTDEATGEKHVVSKGNMVRQGLSRIYMVQSDYDLLKAKVPTREEPQP